MKQLIYLIIPALFACTNTEKQNTEITEKEVNIKADSIILDKNFDAELAEKYGADEYGMKPYVMAFLKSGPNAPKDSAHAVELQSAHMKNIGRLAEEGKLILAGPFYGTNKKDFRGIYIFNTSSLDSAKAYTESDPAIKYGSLKMELINWYGSAALMGVNEEHKKIAEKEI